MNTPNVDAGRLERRVRRVSRKTMPSIHGFCSFYPFGAIRGVPLLRLTALVRTIKLCAPYMAFGFTEYLGWNTSIALNCSGDGVCFAIGYTRPL